MTFHRPPRDRRPIRSAAELTACWRTLLVPEPFAVRSLRLLFLDPAGGPAGPVISLDDLADGPYDLATGDLVTICRDILEGPGGGGSVALLMSRPGGAPWTVSDRAWGRYLTRCATEVGQAGDRPQWPVHLAHRYDVLGLPGEPDQRAS